MGPGEDETPAPGAPPEEEQLDVDGGHVLGRRKPDGKRLDEVGDPVPLERHPHHGG
jgi:hypothetical protein